MQFRQHRLPTAEQDFLLFFPLLHTGQQIAVLAQVFDELCRQAPRFRTKQKGITRLKSCL